MTAGRRIPFSLVSHPPKVNGEPCTMLSGDYASQFGNFVSVTNTDSLSKLRNASVHATNRNWAKKLPRKTAGNLMSSLVQPLGTLDASFHPQLGSRFKYGEYTHFVDEAGCFCMGQILQEFGPDDQLAKRQIRWQLVASSISPISLSEGEIREAGANALLIEEYPQASMALPYWYSKAGRPLHIQASGRLSTC